jgi:hypothetical protein
MDRFEGEERRTTARRREDQCYFHAAHEAMMKEHQRRLDEAAEITKELGRVMDEKVSIRLFVVLCTFIMAGLGFQLAIYNSIKTVESKVAVIESKLKAIDDERHNGTGRSGYLPQEFLLNWGVNPYAQENE